MWDLGRFFLHSSNKPFWAMNESLPSHNKMIGFGLPVACASNILRCRCWSQNCLETPCAFNWDTKSINIAYILVSNSCILAYPYCILFIYPHLMNAPLCLLFWTGCPNRSLPTMVMDTSKNHVASQVLAGWNLDLPTWETFERIWLKWFFSYVQVIGIEWNHHDYISYQPFENAKFSFYEETSTEIPQGV